MEFLPIILVAAIATALIVLAWPSKKPVGGAIARQRVISDQIADAEFEPVLAQPSQNTPILTDTDLVCLSASRPLGVTPAMAANAYRDTTAERPHAGMLIKYQA